MTTFLLSRVQIMFPLSSANTGELSLGHCRPVPMSELLQPPRLSRVTQHCALWTPPSLQNSEKLCSVAGGGAGLTLRTCSPALAPWSRLGRQALFSPIQGLVGSDTKQNWLGLVAVSDIYISNLPLAAVSMATRPPSNQPAEC